MQLGHSSSRYASQTCVSLPARPHEVEARMTAVGATSTYEFDVDRVCVRLIWSPMRCGTEDSGEAWKREVADCRERIMRVDGSQSGEGVARSAASVAGAA